MMKLTVNKIITLIITGLLLFAAAPLNANALTQDVFTYEVSNGQATIVKCDQAAKGELTIPDTLGGYLVTSIGESAFVSCSSLSSITIPKSVKSIGHSAFLSCNGLTSINVSKANKAYNSENGVLFNKSKTKLIKYPSSKTGSSYTIPNSVISIDSYAFHYCDLKSITIQNSVSSIGEAAFSWCESLTTVTIPNSVVSIGAFAFEHTNWYEKQPDGLIYAGKVAYHFKGIIPDNTTIVLKTGTKGIAGGAFETDKVDSDNPGLIDISIPDSVTNIRERAFFGCTGLKSVTIPKSVVSIGEDAFGYYVRIEYAEKFPGFTINCFADTAGLKYAKENGFAYHLLPASGTATDLTTIATHLNTTSTIVTTTVNGSTSTKAASTDSSSDTDNIAAITAVIIITVALIGVAATAVLIVTKKKKNNNKTGGKMNRKKTIYKFAVILLAIATIYAAVIVSIKASQSAKYQIHIVEKTYGVKLPDAVKSLIFESIAEKPSSYYSAAKIIIPEDEVKGFVDSLDDFGYRAYHLEDAHANRFVDWWKLDTGKISGYYDKTGGDSRGMDIYEIFISNPNEGSVTLYISKYAASGSMME